MLTYRRPFRFQPEFRKQKIELEYRIDQTYVDTGIEWVMADLARVGQVLINLVSNAIKFTAKKDGEKKVIISVAASPERPDSYPPNVVFFSADEDVYRMDATNSSEWGTGDVRYVMVAVKDTGIGISGEGQKRLFERFKQATPKTGEIYGGSGLGLNISRKLCHLHGGEIGVSSKEGDGSTFGFFFTVRRSEQPDDYQGRPEDDELELDVLRSQVKELGNANPSEVDPQRIPDSLTSPPVTKDEDATPNPKNQKDDRYYETQNAAKDMEDSKPESRDDYAKAECPKNSKEHQEKTHLQSAALTSSNEADEGRSDRFGGPSSPRSPRTHVLLVEDNIINQVRPTSPMKIWPKANGRGQRYSRILADSRPSALCSASSSRRVSM